VNLHGTQLRPTCDVVGMGRFNPLQNVLETWALVSLQKTLRDCVPCPHVAEHGPHAK
jgi:hypothetical protein